jgi:hypothetical protein
LELGKLGIAKMLVEDEAKSFLQNNSLCKGCPNNKQFILDPKKFLEVKFHFIYPYFCLYI